MAKSMNPAWLLKSLTSLLIDETSIPRPPKVVHLIQCNTELGSVVISDGQNFIVTYLTDAALTRLKDGSYTLDELKYSVVKISNYHFSIGTICAANR